MKTSELEARMRALEAYHSLKVLPACYLVIRVDGRSFTKLTAKGFTKPFDERFSQAMETTAGGMLSELQALYAYTESDEISLLFGPAWDLFERELEKLVSVTAGMASAYFTQASGVRGHFDSRVWVGTSRQAVIDYFLWRQTDATRCALNGWCYWTLRQDGLNARQATSRLERMTVEGKNELLFEHGINFNDLPVWQRRGLGLYWETVLKEGYNPVKRLATTAMRRQLRVNCELPLKADYAAFLGRFLGAAENLI